MSPPTDEQMTELSSDQQSEEWPPSEIEITGAELDAAFEHAMRYLDTAEFDQPVTDLPTDESSDPDLESEYGAGYVDGVINFHRRLVREATGGSRS